MQSLPATFAQLSRLIQFIRPLMAGFLTWMFILYLAIAATANPVFADDPRCGVLPDLDELRSEHLSKLNAIRSREGLGVLKPNATLNQVAQDYACLLARTDHFDHVGPDGTTPSDRARAGGYEFCSLAENIAKGYQSVDTVLRGWVKSEGHLRNIRHRAMTEIGFGVTYATGAPGAPTKAEGLGSLSDLAESLDGRPRDEVLPPRVYLWVQVFGKPC